MNRDRSLPSSFAFSQILFFRLLAIVCLIAHGSLAVQITGLVGEQGILPIAEYIQILATHPESQGFWSLPCVFWINSSDFALQLSCLIGIGLSLLLLFGIATRLVICLLWLNYLSLFQAGQVFLGFQWDTLLLETLLFSLFIAPAIWLPNWVRSRSNLNPRTKQAWQQRADDQNRQHAASGLTDAWKFGRLAMWWLLFKLMFLSGITKLLSGDETWRDLTAMSYHYFTQPLPNPVSWFLFQQPEWFHKASTVGMFAVELIVPFFIFGPRRLRHIAAFLMIGLQMMIGFSGNYGFFNLLTAALCVLLFDDRFFQSWLIRKWIPALPAPRHANSSSWLTKFAALALAMLLVCSGLKFTSELTFTRNARKNPDWINKSQRYLEEGLIGWVDDKLFAVTDRFASINGFGLFRVMTTERPEIVFEISDDGRQWRELTFRYKPGDPARGLPVVAPHMPRLDWQMWFAALNPSGNQFWIERLLLQAYQGASPVEKLLKEPAEMENALFVRLAIYRYRFTTSVQGDDTGQWWIRELRSRSVPIRLDHL